MKTALYYYTSLRINMLNPALNSLKNSFNFLRPLWIVLTQN
jgi:hypothetical protein